jgi:hypothetical protein
MSVCSKQRVGTHTRGLFCFDAAGLSHSCACEKEAPDRTLTVESWVTAHAQRRATFASASGNRVHRVV